MSWRKNRKALLILAIALLVLIVFYFVGRGYVGRIVSKNRAEVGKGGGGAPASNREEKIVFEEGSLPENFPKDFPIYQGAKLSSSWTAEGEETEGISVVWETNSQVMEVSEYYKQELEKRGWEITLSSEMEDSVTFSFDKEEIGGFIGISTGEGKTVISVTLRVK